MSRPALLELRLHFGAVLPTGLAIGLAQAALFKAGAYWQGALLILVWIYVAWLWACRLLCLSNHVLTRRDSGSSMNVNDTIDGTRDGLTD